MLVVAILLQSYNYVLKASPSGIRSANASSIHEVIMPDTVITPDTVIIPDTSLQDTLVIKESEDAMDARVTYSCKDSIRFDFREQKVYLYGDAEITYEDINLKADYVNIDFTVKTLYATGMPDSTGKMAGNPVFTEGEQSFKAKTMRYNYETRKGYIEGVFTEGGQGYLHGDRVKKFANNDLNISGGSYTTCDLEENPHYGFHYNKSKVIPGKRIVTGPVYLVVEGVPTPLALPFGWFPTEHGKKNGLIIPSYGESANRGFYLDNGGYYFSVGEHLDFTILGDIYSKGSWAIKPSMRYRKRYKYNGKINFGFSDDVLGTPNTPDYSSTRNFSIIWSHRQDKAARPRSSFSADVNIKSSTYNRFNPVSSTDYLSNTYRSSIAWQTTFGDKFLLTINAGHTQNTLTHDVNVTLPEVNFTMNRVYPFRFNKLSAGTRWYENITVNYNMNAVNKFSAADSVFFTTETLNMASNGIKHSMPINSPIKLLKYFTMTNSINFTDRMYFQSIQKYWSDDTLFVGNDTIVGYLVIDTIPGFKNAIDFGFSSYVTTKIYGMFRFGKNSPLNAIRHVFTPTLSFAYTPDFGAPGWGYYDSYTNSDGKEIKYSKFEGAVYGSPPGRKSGKVGLKLANILEIKVRSRKDTITGFKKIVLLENFAISGYYDFSRDSLKMSKILVTGRTRLFKKLTIQYRSTWDPYILDSTGTRNLNQFEWNVNKRFLRLDRTNWSVSLSWRFSAKDFEKKTFKSDVGTAEELEEINSFSDAYIDWDIPWDISINYTLNYTLMRAYPEYNKQTNNTLVQTLGLNGNVSITPKWKIGFRTGWDFVNNDLSYTSISIYRDLHCWEMRFNWIPTGFQKSWNFSINAKASILQDLKLTKKKDFRDF